MGDHSTPTFTGLADLASARVGGRAVATSDDFFAPTANLIKPEPAVWIPDKYTAKGKWMDGWESRRRRVSGHDWCIVQLGMRGIVHGVNVDTSHFTGNYPSHCSIEAVDCRGAFEGVVARLRVHGEVSVDWKKVASGNRVTDLASITNGGLFLDASDSHCGTGGALIMPERAKNMGDGRSSVA